MKLVTQVVLVFTAIVSIAFAGHSIPFPPNCPTGLPFNDVDILNFALCLECLEAEFYSFAAYGKGMNATLLGGGPGSVGGQKANLSAYAQPYANEIARIEVDHVALLRKALGKDAVKCPKMDIGKAFSVAADLALNKTLSPPFNPYTNDIFFAHGVYIFEDVGVTAYNGAAPYIFDKQYLAVAASILGTEAYQAGAVRFFLSTLKEYQLPYGITIGLLTNKIAELRSKLSKAGFQDDFGVLNQRTRGPRILDADANSLVFSRLPPMVISIIAPFFPEGLNGYFK